MGGMNKGLDAVARAGVALRALLNGSATELFSVAAAIAATHAARLEQISTPNLIGTADDTAAAVGYAGEIKSAIVLIGSPVAIATATPYSITGLTLTAGRWLVRGVAGFIPDATTNMTTFTAGISLVNDTTAIDGNRANITFAPYVPGAVRTCFCVPTIEVVVSAAEVSKPVYLVQSATFTVAGMGAFGRITATRL